MGQLLTRTVLFFGVSAALGAVLAVPYLSISASPAVFAQR